jgi:hypothetical protein
MKPAKKITKPGKTKKAAPPKKTVRKTAKKKRV